MGTGTTAISALINNRKYCGFELNAEYYKNILSRIKKTEIQDNLFT
jgi:DNA modification methylase